MMSTVTLSLGLFAALAAVVGAVGPELAKRIAQGDAEALRKAYDEYAGRVFSLALRIVRSKEEAEDVVQDTFVEVWRRAGDYDEGRGELASWIMAMARSRCIDRVRRARVRSRYAQTPQQHEAAATPDQLAAAHEDGSKLRKVLTGLPDEQRLAVELAYFDGLTQQQIAEQTGTPLGTVKTRLRLGLEKLSAQLEELR
jgi:RNA polymerase sigma-70 factor (ECF subfamily)